MAVISTKAQAINLFFIDHKVTATFWFIKHLLKYSSSVSFLYFTIWNVSIGKCVKQNVLKRECTQSSWQN